jgi:Flp pilus assembly protein TadD
MIVFRNDPTQLTENDYIQLLSVDPNPEVLAKAVEIYDNETLYAIAAKAEANAGNYDQAIEYYKKAGDSKEVMNNIACCYLLKGDAKNAEKYLEKTKGLDVYEGNQNELRKVVLNNKYFK